MPQTREVLEHGQWLDRGGQYGRIRCDDQVLAEAALEAEPGHAERAVLEFFSRSCAK